LQFLAFPHTIADSICNQKKRFDLNEENKREIHIIWKRINAAGGLAQ